MLKPGDRGRSPGRFHSPGAGAAVRADLTSLRQSGRRPLIFTPWPIGRRAALAVLATVLIGCAAAAPTPTARPTPLRLARPKPRPSPTPYSSGGLGLFRDEWESRHGAARGQGPYFSYAGGRLGAAFANDLVWYVERTWAEPVGVEIARAESRLFFPPDARTVRFYQTKALRRVDLYASSSLAERFRVAAENAFRVDPWRGVDPGTFIVYYREIGDLVGSIVISTGDNP
jgi:hypothetical protein